MDFESIAAGLVTELYKAHYTTDMDHIMAGVRVVVDDASDYASILEAGMELIDGLPSPDTAERSIRVYLKALYNGLPDLDSGLYESERINKRYYA